MTRVRLATADDADVLSDVHVASWRAAYRGLFPAEFLESEAFAAQRLESWRSRRWLVDDTSTLFITTIDDGVVGFGHAGAERVDGEPPLPSTGRGELYSFYLHPEAWGSGAARPLLEACEAALRERGFAEAVLWVLRDNARAQGFYARSGWSPTGAEGTWAPEWMPGVPEVAELQYGRSL